MLIANLSRLFVLFHFMYGRLVWKTCTEDSKSDYNFKIREKFLKEF